MNQTDLGTMIQFLGTLTPIMNDISKAESSLKKSIENNYLKRIYDMAANEREGIKKKPTKEITLLRAVKNYADKPSAQMIDNIINTIDIIRTIEAVQNKMISVAEHGIESQSKDNNKEEIKFSFITCLIMALYLIKN